MTQATCPHCGHVITSLNITGLTGKASAHKQWNCIAYTCPLCSRVISAQIDPIALYADTLDAVQRQDALLTSRLSDMEEALEECKRLLRRPAR